ncbi:hypothetical protein BDR07DRAFT_1370868 [Suillus spraguei]|nr:hypothetical protein BDR07DRAFT_1370868 [Suillus spraguei]
MSEAVNDIQPPATSQSSASSMAVTTSESARQRRKIAALEEKLQVLEARHAAKKKGRAIRHIVTLYDLIEDLIAENDKRCKDKNANDNVTIDQEHLQMGYITPSNVIPLGRGLMVLMEMTPQSSRVSSPTGLLCLTELDWLNPIIKAWIRDHADGYIGLFKSTLLIQAFKAIFTSLSSAKDVNGEGDGANIIENNRCTRKDFSGKKVEMHAVQIIKMHRVSPHSIAYVACQTSLNKPLVK